MNDKTNPPAEKAGKKVEARVLVDCAHGKVNDVVLVDANLAEESSELDSSPAAVRYAKAHAPKKDEGGEVVE